MKSLTRRQFLSLSSKSTAGLLLARHFTAREAPRAAFVESLWSGALAPNSAQVNARLDHDSVTVRLLVSTSPDLSSPLTSGYYTADLATNNRMVGLPIAGLASDTQYYYGIEADGLVDDTNRGQFKTPADGPQSFTFAFSACADTASTHIVFDTIRLLNPLFFLHTGDMHYENIDLNDRSLYRAAFDAVLGSPQQAALYRALPVAYMWDDHDYGPNDSDATSPGRLAARLTYQEYVPHFPLPAGSGDVPIYQAFSIGCVRFILTDLRSERTPKTAPDDANKTMMGSAQKAWFKNELLAASGRDAVIIWVSTVPWIGAATVGEDYWASYSTERQELANFIRDNAISGLVMLSGDAHMIALDDGTNSDYAVGGGAAFPVIHAAALDRDGLIRGGPYSHGTYPGRGQFGLLTITDDGSSMIGIAFSGRDSTGNSLLDYSFDLPACPASTRTYIPLVRGP